MKPRKPRNLKKKPKWMMPKTYAEFLQKAVAEEGRANKEGHRPAAHFSFSCLKNLHQSCSGFVVLDERGREHESVQCLCHCHDAELIV